MEARKEKKMGEIKWKRRRKKDRGVKEIRNSDRRKKKEKERRKTGRERERGRGKEKENMRVGVRKLLLYKEGQRETEKRGIKKCRKIEGDAVAKH